MATQAFGPGIRALSVYDTTNGTVVQIDGADISPESTITRTTTTRNSSKGGVSALNKVWELTVQFADASAFASLDAEASQTRKWQVVAAGINGKNLQWYEDSTFVLEESVDTDPTSDSNFPYILRMRHISETPEIYNNVNLMAYLGWSDADSNGYADNYSNTGFSSPTFVSGLQTVTSSFSVSLGFRGNIVFPLSGIEITASLYTETTSGSPSLRLDTRNYADTSIQTVTISHSNSSVVSDDLTVQSATYTISSSLCSSLASGETAEFKYPALTTNGQLTTSDSFINY